MGARLLLALAALVGLMWLIQRLSQTNAVQRAQLVRQALVWGVAGLLLLLVATGRIPWLFALIAAALPWIQRLLMAHRAWHHFKGARGPTAGQASRVVTRFLAMTLDHDSGAMNGEVLEGEQVGRQLNDLDLDTVLRLLAIYQQQDVQSAQLLAAYLDRAHGADWRERAHTAPGTAAAAGGAMAHDEALQVLGLTPGASREDIIAAHRRLMQKLHPDRGGPGYLASKVNQAKDVLLAGCG